MACKVLDENCDLMCNIYKSFFGYSNRRVYVLMIIIMGARMRLKVHHPLRKP